MQKILICMLALLTAACGWHLRGTMTAQATIDRLYLTAREAHGDLVNELRQMLQAGNVSLVESADQAPYRLSLLEERSDRRVVGVGGDALASAYELTLEADYEIRDSHNQLLIPIATSSVTRSYDYSPSDATSASQQEALLHREMRRDLAQQILRRLYAVTANGAVAVPPAEPLEVEHGQTSP
jgi:LPS-assembly lipoprotein